MSDTKIAKIEPGAVVEIIPTLVWIESDAFGGRHVVMQHEGCEPFTYATFHYDYRYTSNGGTWRAAQHLAKALGATDPVEEKARGIDFEMPTADELRKQIAALQELLSGMERAASAPAGEDAR